MGFNPFRVRRRSTADIVLVVVTLTVAAALVVWAARGVGITRTWTRPDALSILERRYATSEIDRDEFTERRRVLEAHQETRR